MKKILASLAAVALMAFGAVGVLAPEHTMAVTSSENGATQAGNYLGNGANSANQGNSTNLMETVKVIINVIIGVVGLIAVVMVIIGGIGFTTSQGDANKVTKARNTLLYGIIGLVVAILAFAIVNFVLSNVFGSGV